MAHHVTSQDAALRLTTYGGAETVTGSEFLVEGRKGKVLIDCGLEQGGDHMSGDPRAPFLFDASSLDAVVITHAHLDHVGRAPKLMREGFSGAVYMTPPTHDLSELLLSDSLHIMQEREREEGVPAVFDERDLKEFLSRIVELPYHEEKEVAAGLSLYLRNTGHILGSASVRLKTEEGSALAITSDIGNSPATLLPDAEPIPDADVLFIESVYGDRANPEKEHRVEALAKELGKAVARGGTVLLPAFSIERTQLMLYEIGKLFEEKIVPEVPVFLDAPLAIKVTDVYRKWGGVYFNVEAKEEAKDHDLFRFPFLSVTPTREESETIHSVKGPKIIIAGAGMSHGGRIGKWEARYLPDSTTTLVMVGYQAPGTLGRVLQDGGRKVRIGGREVRVRAHVTTLHGWSGHADRDGLLAFAEACLPRTKSFIVGMGEPSSARFLAQRIHDYLGRPAIVPFSGQTFVITKEGAKVGA